VCGDGGRRDRGGKDIEIEECVRMEGGRDRGGKDIEVDECVRMEGGETQPVEVRTYRRLRSV
jgi:hypothetical protein